MMAGRAHGARLPSAPEISARRAESRNWNCIMARRRAEALADAPARSEAALLSLALVGDCKWQPPQERARHSRRSPLP